MLNIAVLISGRGSNLQALIKACQEKSLPATITHVISNRDNAQGLAYAKEAGIPTTVLRHNGFPDRETFDKAMHQVITQSGATLVCMAGFMRLLSPWFVKKWHNRLINIHPSLLPSFKGLHAAQQALDAGVKITGCTVHFVREAMDAGPIIVQKAVPVLTGDTEEILSARILKEEHKAYPEALTLIAGDRVVIKDEVVVIKSVGQEQY